MSLHLDPLDDAHCHLDAMSASIEREAANAELLRAAFTDALCGGRSLEQMSTPAYSTPSCPLWELVHSDRETAFMLVQVLRAGQNSADPAIRMPAQAAILLLANDYADSHAMDMGD